METGTISKHLANVSASKEDIKKRTSEIRTELLWLIPRPIQDIFGGGVLDQLLKNGTVKFDIDLLAVTITQANQIIHNVPRLKQAWSHLVVLNYSEYGTGISIHCRVI